jgi:hypothetical protein
MFGDRVSIEELEDQVLDMQEAITVLEEAVLELQVKFHDKDKTSKQ